MAGASSIAQIIYVCGFYSIIQQYIYVIVFRYVVPKPRSECTKGEQLVVTFAAGYIAGVFCAIVSHPADTVVSKLNQNKGASALDIAKKLGFVGTYIVFAFYLYIYSRPLLTKLFNFYVANVSTCAKYCCSFHRRDAMDCNVLQPFFPQFFKSTIEG